MPKKAKKPVTIEDVKAFIKESRKHYEGAPTEADVWETGDTLEIAQAACNDGRLQILDELEDYLKRGN